MHRLLKTTPDLREELSRREKEIELLKDIALAVGSELNLDRVFDMVAERARELIEAETLLIPLLDEKLQSYTYQSGAGMNADEIVGETLPIDFGICGWVWKNKRAWWRGVLDELDAKERNRWEKEAGSVILVPLIGKDHFLGGIAGINKIGGGEFTKRDLDLLSLFASQVAIAIENAMAYSELEEARNEAQSYQQELYTLNKDLRQINQQLEQLALYDQLTNLPNRSLLLDRLTQGLLKSERNNEPITVFMIDLDMFKNVNDSLGHEAGDRILNQVGNRLVEVVSEQGTVGRMGGDEFAVVLNNISTKNAKKIAKDILVALEENFTINQHVFPMTASIGIATYPEHGEDASTLLRNADMAMYSAKRNSSSVRVFDKEIEALSIGQLNLLGEVRQAVNDKAFKLHFQPKINIQSGRLIGAEVLGRWHNENFGDVSPIIFIPALEQTGLIHAYTECVIEESIKQVKKWRKEIGELELSINLSLQSLLEPKVSDRLLKIISQSGVTGSLIFEITENVFLTDYQRLNDLLKEWRGHGIRFSIDDFGTGHSSLSRLKKLPVSELKIDRSFVSDMYRNLDDEVIVRSTIDLAHNLGLLVVAEGIEDELTYKELKAMGCDIAQGYYFERPLSAERFEEFSRKTHWRIDKAI